MRTVREKRIVAGTVFLILCLAGTPGAQERTHIPKAAAGAAPAGPKGGEDVKKAQDVLTKEGFNPGPIDGVMGPKTEAAIRAFQEKVGLKPSGLLDEETKKRLFDLAGGATRKIIATVEGISEDRTSLTVTCIGEELECGALGDRAKAVSLSVKGKELQERLRNFQRGDILIFEVARERDENVVKDFAAKRIPVSKGQRGWVLGITALVLLLFLLILLRKNFPRLIVGQDGRYSNSKFQMAAWFGVLVTTYVATLWLRVSAGGTSFTGGVDIPQNLLILSGISGFTFAAAKAITSKKVEEARRKAEEAARAPGGAVHALVTAAAQPEQILQALAQVTQAAGQRAKPAAGPGQRGLIRNLLADDRGDPDIGDIEMVIMTLIAVGVYGATVFKFLGSIELLKVVTLPDVDTTILALFGIGKGTYLTKKYATPAGQQEV